MKEIEFYDIVGYEGFYKVSMCGVVKSLQYSKEKILKGTMHKKGYKMFSLRKYNKQQVLGLHQILAITFLNHTVNGLNTVVDHINGNTEDNRLSNLQLIGNRENSSKDKKAGTSKYVGVCWHKRNNKWVSSITINGKQKFLGYFINEIEASNAYQQALRNII